MKKIIVVECLSSCANYIKDIFDEGYEPVLLELYCPERESLAYRMPHDLCIRDLYTDLYPEGKQPVKVQAPESYEETLELVRKMDPALVIPGSDEGLIWAARLTEDLNLTGNRLDTIKKIRNKAECQQIIADAGIRSIKGRTVSSLEEALDFYQELGQDRIVVKPLSSGASKGVFICENKEQFTEAVKRDLQESSDATGIKGTILLQEYVDGIEYIVNTVSYKGHHKVTATMYYEKTLMPGKARIYRTMNTLPPDSETGRSIIEYTLKVLEAVGLEYGPVHSEIMIDEKGPVLIEANLRLSGAVQRGTWQKKVLGESESTSALHAYLHPEEFLEDKRTILMDAPMSGSVKFLTLDEDRFVERNLTAEAFADIPGFDYGLGMGDNRPYAVTVDLATASGLVFLAHEDPELIKTSVDAIEDREKNEPERIYIFG